MASNNKIVGNSMGGLEFGGASGGGGFGMPGCKVGDMTIGICNHGLPCCPHITIGWHIIGSNSTKIENMDAVRILDQSVTTCPHCGMGIAIEGASNTMIDNLPAHRFLDQVLQGAGTAISITGSWTNLIK